MSKMRRRELDAEVDIRESYQPMSKRTRSGSKATQGSTLDEKTSVTSAKKTTARSTNHTRNQGPDEPASTIRKRGRPKARVQTRERSPMALSPSKKVVATPVKTNMASTVDGTPKLKHNLNRSARRKSTRTLIEQTVLGNISDNGEEEEDIAQRIYDSREENELSQEEVDVEDESSEGVSAPETPSKPGRQKQSKRRKISPNSPRNLPPHEVYFSQNCRSGGLKTSNNNLSSLALLDHEEYFSLIRKYKDPHSVDIEFLQELHAGSFNQWQFELSQDFNICVYGWGSKRSLLMKFAEHLYNTHVDHSKHKIVVVNGYVANLTIRDVLNTLAGAFEHGQKLTGQPAEMLDDIFFWLSKDKGLHITVIVHSIDRAPLRRASTQTILSRLSSHPQMSFVVSADHISFPLLWDSSLRSTYNFLFHDCTTFQPYNAEMNVVDEVHELLGRSGRRVGGKEGVSFVLKSLPENAKNLFRVLIGEQLAAMDNSSGDGFGGDDHDDDDYERIVGNTRSDEPGVEYRVLYQKAVEEFICSNEMNFRTLLKEFHDHQMINSRKDALGTETLSVPFRKEELEAILEDIMS